jgi:hypothetical protein
MRTNVDRLCRLCGALVLLSVPLISFAFNLSGQRWIGSSITMHLQLGPTAGTLLDGSNSWGESAEYALASWNNNIANIKFVVVRDSTASRGDGNGVNNVFFSPTIYLDEWDNRTLAMALTRSNTNGVRTEVDVIFNANISWNSYPGPLRTTSGGGTLYDFRRVALHEFGHVLGLDHPDDIGQRVSSVMNSATSNTDSLAADDIAGAKAIYDSSAPIPAAPTIYIQGAVSFRTTGSTLLNLQVGRVQNDRVGYTTGSLRLDLWAMPSPFDNGLPTGSRLLGRHNFPEPLRSGFGYPDVNVNVAYTVPPSGTYYVAMVLGEFTGGSGAGWTIRDFRQFDNRLTIGNSAAPAILAQPVAQSIRTGADASFTVFASGSPPLSYQWRRDGVALPGATNAVLSIPSTRPINAGSYSVVVANATGSVVSSSAALSVNWSRLINLSTRGLVQAGQTLTPGFVMRGTGSKQLLVRAIGPTLTSFGLTTALSDTSLAVIPGGSSTVQASHDDWGGSAALTGAFSAVGAFPLAANSRDAAVQTSLAVNAGGYTVRVAAGSATATGLALAEVYDADSENSSARLVNVSTRGFVGTGLDPLTPGFVIRGNASKRLLIRAIGPGLAQFGVGSLLADPQLMVVPAGQTSSPAVNDNWGGSSALKAAFTEAGAFVIADASRDAALVVTLAPGAYSVVVSGVGNTTGNALVEVYDLDP